MKEYLQLLGLRYLGETGDGSTATVHVDMVDSFDF
jgi:hypothetical protein